MLILVVRSDCTFAKRLLMIVIVQLCYLAAASTAHLNVLMSPMNVGPDD